MAIADPRDISGLLVWLSADAISGVSDGANMPNWSDQSGNGNDAVITTGSALYPKYGATAGQGGGPAVWFPSASTDYNYFQFPLNLMSGVTSAEVMMTVKAAGNSGASLWKFSNAGGDEHYAFTDGNVYENWGASARPGFAPSVSVASWRRYNIWSATNDWAVRLDETTQTTSASNTVTFVSQPTLSTASTRFAGHVGCVVIYDRKLTTTERADLATWLAANPSGGVPAAPAPSGTLAASLPLPTVTLAGAYVPPPVSGALAGTLPVPSLALAGTYLAQSANGALAAVLPVPTVALAGSFVPAPAFGSLAASLPLPTVTVAGAYTAPPGPPTRTGFGLVLDSTATVSAEAPLEVFPPGPGGVPDPVQHIITPTVPAPVLTNGRPQ